MDIRMENITNIITHKIIIFENMLAMRQIGILRLIEIDIMLSISH